MFITMYTLYIDPFQNSSINCHKHYAIPDMLARIVRTSENTVRCIEKVTLNENW